MECSHLSLKVNKSSLVYTNTQVRNHLLHFGNEAQFILEVISVNGDIQNRLKLIWKWKHC
jgi:hypothetical protein